MANGGNIVLRPGKATGGQGIDVTGFDGSIIFLTADETEVLRLYPDGTISIHGRPVANDLEIVQMLKQWLSQAIVDFEDPE